MSTKYPMVSYINSIKSNWNDDRRIKDETNDTKIRSSGILSDWDNNKSKM